MLELWMVRHGQTAWNISGRIQGWTDISLNDVGRSQAQLLQKHLDGTTFQAIISSDLQRAYETACILQAQTDVPVQTDCNLRERSFGDGEGLTGPEMDEQFPNGIPNQETVNSVVNRGIQFLAETSTKYGSGRVLAVSHGGMIRSLLRHFGVVDIPYIRNTSISVLCWNGSNWRVEKLNWHDHLPNQIDADKSQETVATH